MAQRREPPGALDYFPTPPWATRALFRHVLPAIGISTISGVWAQWIEGVGRYDNLFRNRPPSLYAPFVERVPMVKGRRDPDANTATSYAWFVWANAIAGPSQVFWIPPGCRRSLTSPADREQFAAWSLTPADAPLLDRI